MLKPKSNRNRHTGKINAYKAAILKHKNAVKEGKYTSIITRKPKVDPTTGEYLYLVTRQTVRNDR